MLQFLYMYTNICASYVVTVFIALTHRNTQPHTHTHTHTNKHTIMNNWHMVQNVLKHARIEKSSKLAWEKSLQHESAIKGGPLWNSRPP